MQALVTLEHNSWMKDLWYLKGKTDIWKKNVCFQENAVFIDTKKMAIIKKKVRKLEDQLGYESRRWDLKTVCQLSALYEYEPSLKRQTWVCIFPHFFHQIMERCDIEPEAERHWRSNRCQTPTGGETESRGQREEGEREAVGD